MLLGQIWWQWIVVGFLAGFGWGAGSWLAGRLLGAVFH